MTKPSEGLFNIVHKQLAKGGFEKAFLERGLNKHNQHTLTMIPFCEDSRITVASVNVQSMKDGKEFMQMVNDHCSPTYVDTSDTPEDLYSMDTFADIAHDTSVPERLREFCLTLAKEEGEASYIRFINVPQ